MNKKVRSIKLSWLQILRGICVSFPQCFLRDFPNIKRKYFFGSNQRHIANDNKTKLTAKSFTFKLIDSIHFMAMSRFYCDSSSFLWELARKLLIFIRKRYREFENHCCKIIKPATIRLASELKAMSERKWKWCGAAISLD